MHACGFDPLVSHGFTWVKGRARSACVGGCSALFASEARLMMHIDYQILYPIMILNACFFRC